MGKLKLDNFAKSLNYKTDTDVNDKENNLVHSDANHNVSVLSEAKLKHTSSMSMRKVVNLPLTIFQPY